MLQGDAATKLRTLKDKSVQLCMTSPPYHGQRVYHAGAQEIGSEPTWAEHLEALLAVFDEVYRVLRDDAVLVINYGDKYSPNRKWGGLGLPAKCLAFLPERLALALVDGVGKHQRWVAHAKSPWPKRNGLPDSARDRPGMSLENLYMFSKKAHPYWDAEAVRRTFASGSHNGSRFYKGKTIGADGHHNTQRGEREERAGRAFRMGDPWVDSVRAMVGCEHSGLEPCEPTNDGRHDNPRGRQAAWTRNSSGATSNATGGMVLDPESGLPLGQYEATEGFRASEYGDFRAADGKPVDHYATYPTRLVLPWVRAATSEKGCCPECGAPWVRVVKQELVKQYESRHGGRMYGGSVDASESWTPGMMVSKTLGWRPTCECQEAELNCPVEPYPGWQPRILEPIPCTVLDPFAGVGTTLLVAEREGRDSIGIELNPVYIEIAQARLAKDLGEGGQARTAKLERAQVTMEGHQSEEHRMSEPREGE